MFHPITEPEVQGIDPEVQGIFNQQTKTLHSIDDSCIRLTSFPTSKAGILRTTCKKRAFKT